MSYDWEVWDCRDNTKIHSAAFFPYRFDARYESSALSFGDATPVKHAAVATYYKCDSQTPVTCAAMDRDTAQTLAVEQAQIWPDYKSAGSASLSSVRYIGDYEVDAAQVNTNIPGEVYMDFHGCSLVPVGCLDAHVISLDPL